MKSLTGLRCTLHPAGKGALWVQTFTRLVKKALKHISNEEEHVNYLSKWGGEKKSQAQMRKQT